MASGFRAVRPVSPWAAAIPVLALRIPQTAELFRAVFREETLWVWFLSVVGDDPGQGLGWEPLSPFPLNPTEQPPNVARGADEVVLETHLGFSPIPGLAQSRRSLARRVRPCFLAALARQRLRLSR
jgi:hypothetical protein